MNEHTATSPHRPLPPEDAAAGFDLARAREETPGVGHVLHFNNAGCSLPPRPVVEAMIAHLELEATIGGYEAHDARRDAVERPYAALARLLNAHVGEIAIVENATRAWDMAFYAVTLRPGDRVLTGKSEYCSNFIAFLHRAKRDGIAIDVAPSTPTGEIDVAALAQMVTPRTRLIAITHVPTSGGLVNPAVEIGAIARRAGVPYLLDACQSVGQMPIDVEAIGCDMLSGTGRKFLRGPRGIGFLYVRRSLLDRLDPPFLDDHAADWSRDDGYDIRDDARRFETPECSFAAKIGLGVAVDYAMGWPMPAVEQRVQGLAETLRGALGTRCGARVHDLGRRRCGIVTFSVPGLSADTIKARLRERDINVTVAVAEATRLDMIPRGLDRIVRASLHYYNSEDEIGIFTETVARIAHEAA
jgi:selenocysteine lyase/cysteine desulfurase